MPREKSLPRAPQTEGTALSESDGKELWKCVIDFTADDNP